MSQSFSNNINSFNVSNSFTVADDRSNILCWLSLLDPRLRHQDIQAGRVERVGEWLLQTEEFRSWYASAEGGGSDKTVLFCYGDPGVGKTFISSLVVDTLCDQAGEQNATVACFYFDFAAQKEQSPTSMLGSLLRQLVCGLTETPEEISRAYQNQQNGIGGRVPQLSDLVKMIQTTSSKKPRTFICIDAVDECVEGFRVKLLDSLNQILQKSPGTRIFVTGRPHIGPEIARGLGGRVTSVSISPKGDDIIRYLHSRLREDTTPDAMDSSLEADLLRKIPEDVSEIFLLVSLNIDAILQETTIHRRRQKLNTMTDGLGLGGAYGATLDRIKGQGGEKARLGMAALMWISHSERPLGPAELCHALAVEIGSPNLNPDNVPSIGTLIKCCQGLVAVEKEASTVRLIHFTLQEYLRAHPELFGKAHSIMAEICLSYLNSQQVRALSASTPPGLPGIPFLEYSSLYWGTHARRDLSNCARLLAHELFDVYKYSNHISVNVLLSAMRWDFWGVDLKKLYLFSGLHCVSYFGIIEIVADLVEVEGCDINQKGCMGATPLVCAALNGQVEVVETLLGRGGVNPDAPDDGGRTPLIHAAINGEEGVVKMLLGRDDVNPNKPDDDGRTPLFHAAINGEEGVVRMLLGRDDVDPDKPDNDGQTPLSWAACVGWEEAVKMLLGRDHVDPNKPDNDGKTPLSYAVKFGQEEVVKMLLRRDDVNPDKPDNGGKTPLSYAAQYGREGVVKMLLRRDDVDPDKPDNDGQTPLSWAACVGWEEAVKMLLGRDHVDPNKPDNDGKTPLSYAVKFGQEEVVKMLLRRDDVNPDKPDNGGKTPLSYAARYGCEGVVKTLLGRDDINPDRPDNDGRTPLSWAACVGREGVVEILLGRDDINPDRPDNDGLTPLSWAACAGREGVVGVLLGRQNASSDRLDDGSRLLFGAAWNGHEEVVKILLGCNNVNPDKPDDDGRTSLFGAAWSGHVGVVKALLGQDGVNPDKADKYGRSPLYCAAKNGHVGVVKVLLGRNDVHPDQPDIDGRTPLFSATNNGHVGVVEALLGRDDVTPDKPDKHGQTPLHCAAWNGHEGLVKILLGRHANPDRLDKLDRKPLWWAVAYGHAGVIALLQSPESTTLSVTQG